MVASFAAVIGSGSLVKSIPYEANNFGVKQVAWLLHSALLGALLVPISFHGGPLFMKTVCEIVGIVGGMTLMAATAPSKEFLKMISPLAIGFGFGLTTSLGRFYLFLLEYLLFSVFASGEK